MHPQPSPKGALLAARVRKLAAVEAPPSAEAPESLKPPLKWAGGKRWQLPELRPLWAPHAARRLVEPFCGGLAVALGLGPKAALLNDVNPHLVNFYRHLQRGLTIGLQMENDEKLFYAHRARFNALLAAGAHECQEAAELFYFLNRTGYNGLCRFNASGGFNVPFGRYATIGYRREFAEYQARFAKWELSNASFEDLPLKRGDFVYADPPYDVQFTTYSKGGFGWDDQVRVAEWLAKHPGPVVLVNQSTPRIVNLYESLGYSLTYLSAPRRISCNGDRTAAREVMGLRNL